MDERWHEIKTIWTQHQWLYILAGFVAGLLAEPFVKALAADALGFLQSLVPEAIGILFTVLIIDSLYQRREAAREERELKARLIREAGSTSNELAKNAIHELQTRGWLGGEDSLLRRRYLKRANLESVEFTEANLEGMSLRQANLKNATFAGVNLQRAILEGADLQNARFFGGSMVEADLFGANLEEVTFLGTDLRGANLEGSNLHQATFISVKFDENTILPDNSKWTPDVDLIKFGATNKR